MDYVDDTAILNEDLISLELKSLLWMQIMLVLVIIIM